ncbi:MAG: single-stranded-DNA-specific exonuclease RecJ [Acidobacteria bacterium]|nr:single-stranded-DNA-specific exonuclease RecJ [Acidobacteriota bacterium]
MGRNAEPARRFGAVAPRGRGAALRGAVWEHPVCDGAAVERLQRELALHPTVARLLVQRGLPEPEAARRFLNPSLDDLHDPSRLADLDRAVGRLLGAIARREPVAVHGDYDADGVSSTVMLRRVLELLEGDVTHFIPERLRDGYGLQSEAVERLHARGVRVIVSVDCGIRSVNAATRARELGVDLIVTDHHEPDAALPPAFAVLNPRRSDCTYPDKDLAGVGVAFKLVQALCQRTGRSAWLRGFAKLAAIGTLADAVPLKGENRVLARVGLDRLSEGPNTVGLRALLEVSGLTGRRIVSDDVAFQVAPRINAAGRMSSADLAAKLLLSTDASAEAHAKTLAESLNAENARRREEDADIVAEARKVIERDPDIGAQNLLVVWAEGWHRGVIGIVASKLVETFARPAIVLSVDGEEAHGSGRSIPGFDLLGALERNADLFIRFGGHKQAAGMVVDASRLKELRRRLAAYANERLDPQDLVPRLTVDAPLPLTAVRGGLLRDLGALEPFGRGNLRPVFHAGPVEVTDGPHTMSKRHLRMTLRQGRATFRAVAWRAAERAALFERHRTLDVAFSLGEDTYKGNHYLQLIIADAVERR